MKAGIGSRVADWLRLPDVPTSEAEAESDARLVSHRGVVERRPGFRQVAVDMQAEISSVVDDATEACSNRTILEIGAGVIALSTANNDVLSSDLRFSSDLDLNLSAYELPVRDRALRAVVAQNVFHHLPDYSSALAEMARVVEPGGVIVLVEPYHGWMARRVFPALFSFEGYDVSADRCASRDSLPNQALSYIVFERDLHEFQSSFPDLRLEFTRPMRSGMRYLATGGLNFRQLAPTIALRGLRRAERSRLGATLESGLALHWMIVLRVTGTTNTESRPALQTPRS